MDLLFAHPVAALLAAVLLFVAAGLGFLVGFRRPRKVDLARIAVLEEELSAARTNAESTQGEIDEHFEASAALFGKLAQDYRSLFEHWADSATRLGVSEGRANAIIDQARSRLLEDGRTYDAPAREAEADDPATDSSDADPATAPEPAPAPAPGESAPSQDEVARAHADAGGDGNAHGKAHGNADGKAADSADTEADTDADDGSAARSEEDEAARARG